MSHDNRPTKHNDDFFKGIAKVSHIPIALLLNLNIVASSNLQLKKHLLLVSSIINSFTIAASPYTIFGFIIMPYITRSYFRIWKRFPKSFRVLICGLAWMNALNNMQSLDDLSLCSLLLQSQWLLQSWLAEL